VRSDVITAVIINITVICNMKPCILVDIYQCFGGTCCLCLQPCQQTEQNTKRNLSWQSISQQRFKLNNFQIRVSIVSARDNLLSTAYRWTPFQFTVSSKGPSLAKYINTYICVNRTARQLKGRRTASSGVLCHVALVRTDVSEELSTTLIRVTRIGELGRMLAVTSKRHTLWGSTQ
jgi:hypothetical protein